MVKISQLCRKAPVWVRPKPFFLLLVRKLEASIICLFLRTFNYPRARSSAPMPTYLPSHPYDCSAKRT